jgi:hypothetical protein
MLPSTASNIKKKGRKTLAHLKDVCSAVAQGKVNLGIPMAIPSTTTAELEAILGEVVQKTKVKVESFEQKVAALDGVATLKPDVVAYREEVAARRLPTNPASWSLAQVQGAWEARTPQERTLTTRLSVLDARPPSLTSSPASVPTASLPSRTT